MKPLSQVLEDMQMNVPAKNQDLSLTPQAGSMENDGKMNQELTLLRQMETPETIDRQLKVAVSLLPNSSVNYQKTSVVSEDYGFLRTREIPQIYTDDPDNVKELYRALQIACKPCAKDEIMKELYAMSLTMARRKDQDLDFKIMIAVYAGDLSEYPRDVILESCKDVRREQRFFPTIADLRDVCEEKFEFRRSLMKEIASIISGVKLLSAG